MDGNNKIFFGRFEIQKIELFTGRGEDRIYFSFDGPKCFPVYPENNSDCIVRTAYGHGLNWLKEAFEGSGFVVEINRYNGKFETFKL